MTILLPLLAVPGRETTEMLRKEDMDCTSSHEEILDEVHKEGSTTRGSRINSISADDRGRDKMSAVPDRKQIEAAVFGMKSNKSSRYDGLTIEVLRLCWSFVGEDYI
ncbi:hypothetical protein R1sor_012086 [Riccia sorocarpa]|uniref:Uncharacterized protein n=1 Tax=Riccia sorocarpa TaxID=122646 RepID=A0ABD3I2T5_9MARC